MPVLGLGTYSLHGDVCVNSVKAALAAGFRKIDTAHMYDNEEDVGQGVRESGVPREEIFVATKLYPNQYSNPDLCWYKSALNPLRSGPFSSKHRRSIFCAMLSFGSSRLR